jgi:hypothetical protein
MEGEGEVEGDAEGVAEGLEAAGVEATGAEGEGLTAAGVDTAGAGDEVFGGMLEAGAGLDIAGLGVGVGFEHPASKRARNNTEIRGIKIRDNFRWLSDKNDMSSPLYKYIFLTN